MIAVDDEPYPHTHNLAKLLLQLGDRFPRVTALEDHITTLAPYAVTGRYADPYPTLEQATSALELAREVYRLAEAAIEEPESQPSA